MTTYTVVTGEGSELTSGVSAAEIERVAQAHADQLGETVYYSAAGGADLDEDDDEDLGTAVDPSEPSVDSWDASADSRETSRAIMDAIWDLASDAADAERIWGEPTDAEVREIVRQVQAAGHNPADLCWGAAGSQWAPRS